jgi:hypothetical protein
VNSALDAAVLGRHDIWRGNRPHTGARAVIASGHAGLDALLPGGGWPLGALIECCRAHDGLGALEPLLPALATLNAEARWLAFVAPPYPLYAPALAQAGLAPQRCLSVSAAATASTTRTAPAPWAAEQLLRGGACAAVLLWWAGEDSNTLRRLQLAAELGGALCVLFRPDAAATQISPAALRLRVLPGPLLELFKCRGTNWHAGSPLRVPLSAPAARAIDSDAPARDAPHDASALARALPPDAVRVHRIESRPSDWRRLARRERERRQ